MNYYPHHIGDYTTATAHLSLLEDGAYRRLMDRYYSTESPLPVDEPSLFRVVRARTPDEQEAIRIVLAEFFDLADAGWTHKRCDAEIDAFRAKSGKASESAKKRWSKPAAAPSMPEQCERIANALPTQCEGNAKAILTKNQEPITKNQEPKKSKAEAAPASRLPADWMPSDADNEFCKTERPDLHASEVVERFRDYWIAQPGAKGRKTDWPATWRNWVRNERRGQSQAPPAYQTANDKAKSFADRLTGKTRHDQPRAFIDINPHP